MLWSVIAAIKLDTGKHYQTKGCQSTWETVTFARNAQKAIEE